MARTAKRVYSQQNEQIDVREFEDISIRFRGDVYILATWLAMSDLAKSTPTRRPHTTLRGLARSIAMLHGTDYANPLKAEDVMIVFRNHGISGNPTLHLGTPQQVEILSPMKLSADASHVAKQLAAPKIDEQSHALEPAARPNCDGE